MVKETISIANALETLNELLALDKEAMCNLLEARVECNEAMAEHDTLQVLAIGKGYMLGILGVLNALFGAREDGWGEITLKLNDNNEAAAFIRTSEWKK